MPFSLKSYLLSTSLLLLVSTNGVSQTQYLDEPLTTPRNQTQSDEPQEDLTGSGIITRQLGNNTLEEYRVSGRTRSVKITPGQGTPYFLIDADGDGEIGARSDSANDGVTGWRIMNW